MNEIPKTKKTPVWAIILSMAIAIPVISIVNFQDFFFGDEDKNNSYESITAESQKTYSFTGNSHKTHKVYLNKGLAIFELTANSDNKSNIAVDFREGDGSYYKGHLFNELGKDWSGSTSLNIQETGIYVINVKINGYWKLEIK